MPLYTLQAAAGGFSDEQQVEPDGWVVPKTSRSLGEGMFVAQVVGRSMEPRIPDRSWCLFRGPVEGSRQGRIVLVQHQSIHDPESSGGSYTVKRYESEKAGDTESWQHTRVTLMPVNPEFEPIVLEAVDEGDVSVVAELIEVLR